MYRRFASAVAGLALAGFLGPGAASAGTILIDDFLTPQSAAVTATAPPTQSAGNSIAALVIGGERDLYVEKTVGDDEERVRARINPLGANLLRQTIDAARGRVVLTWDGADGLFGPGQVQYDGLGGVDFTQAVWLELIVAFSDIPGPVTFTFWDADDPTGGVFAKTTFSVPGGIPSGSAVSLKKTFLSPADFTATGGSLIDIFSSVGAIQMEIDARGVAQEGWDVQFDLVRAVVPEPASIGLMGLGLAALAGYLRRRTKT